MDSSGDGGDEGAAAPASHGPAPVPAPGGGAGGAFGSSRKPTAKRVMKTPYQLEVLEKTYAEDPYPNETTRVELSEKLGLTDRQLQMWFCHRRLKDRKPPANTQPPEEEGAVPVMAPLPVPGQSLPRSKLTVGSAGTYGDQLLPCSRRGPGRSSAVPRISVSEIGRRYYEPQQVMLPPLAPVQLTRAAHQVIDSVQELIGEPLREDGPALGVDFDPLPPGAFGAPIVQDQRKQPFRSYETNIFSGHSPKLLKTSAFLPSMDPFVPSTFTGKRKAMAGNSSHLGAQTVHEYQFLPEQPSDIYERASQSRFCDAPMEASNSMISSLSKGSRFLHGAEQAPSCTFHGQISGSSHLSQHGRPLILSSGSTDYEMASSNINVCSAPIEGQSGIRHVAEYENSLASSEGADYHDEDLYRLNRKRKHREEAKIAKEVGAHEKRIRKEVEKQDVMKRKREMERHDRERKKEEERFMREKQREEERFQKDQRREHKRMEKLLLKQSIRDEKLRQKEELRKEKEAARQKSANERATARRIAREYMELMEDERLELMELVSRSKGLPSMLCLDSDTLQKLDSFRVKQQVYAKKSGIN